MTCTQDIATCECKAHVEERRQIMAIANAHWDDSEVTQESRADWDANETIRRTIEAFPGRTTLSCSFGGPSGMVLLDLALRIEPQLNVFVVDTELLFPETYALIERVERRYGNTADDIRRCRQDLLQHEDGSPLKNVSKYADFFTTSECRDLLFHVQEHQLTVPAIQQFLHDNRLTFIGFTGAVTQNYRARFPDDHAMTDLDQWHVFETENPLGQMGYYVISKGATGPFRVKIRSASFSNVSILPWLLQGVYVPDVITILGSLYFILGDIDR